MPSDGGGEVKIAPAVSVFGADGGGGTGAVDCSKSVHPVFEKLYEAQNKKKAQLWNSNLGCGGFGELEGSWAGVGDATVLTGAI